MAYPECCASLKSASCDARPSAVTLKIDPAVVLATRQYLDNVVIEVKANADKALVAHIAAASPHKPYLQTANALAEIKDGGQVTKALAALGLGNGSAAPPLLAKV